MLRTYITATVLLDIFLLTYTLFTLNLAEPQNTKQLANRKFLILIISYKKALRY